MPRGKKKELRQCKALFVNPGVVPFEARPKGKTQEGVLVTVVKETAKFVTLRYEIPKRGRAKSSRSIIFDMAKELVVFYHEEVVDLSVVEAPEPVAATPPAKVKKAAAAAPTTTGKKRGRPKKVVTEKEAAAAASDDAPKKRRGRPKKVKDEVVEKEGDAPKKRGRPAKKKSISDGKSSSKKKGRKFGSVKKPSFNLDPEDEE